MHENLNLAPSSTRLVKYELTISAHVLKLPNSHKFRPKYYVILSSEQMYLTFCPQKIKRRRKNGNHMTLPFKKDEKKSVSFSFRTNGSVLEREIN